MKPLPPKEEILSQLDYCPETGEFIRKSGKKTAGYVTSNGYLMIGLGYKRYYAHRLAWKLHYNQDPKFIDHLDGDRLNNSIENLRNVDSAKNQKNMKKPKTNTSGVVGVTFDRSRSKWIAQIQVNKKNISLGRYSFFEDAVSARKEAEILYNFHENHGR